MQDDTGVRGLELESHHHIGSDPVSAHLLPGDLWESYFYSLSLSFVICKMGTFLMASFGDSNEEKCVKCLTQFLAGGKNSLSQLARVIFMYCHSKTPSDTLKRYDSSSFSNFHPNVASFHYSASAKGISPNHLFSLGEK